MKASGIKNISCVFVFIILAVAGCKSGEQLARPAETSFEPGKTKITEILAQYGKPGYECAGVFNEKPVTQYVYTLAKTPYSVFFYPEAIPVSVPMRLMTFNFCNDVLVGYLYTSSFKDDNTNFDETKIGLIKANMTQEKELIMIMGRPSGRSIYPVAAQDETIITYSYGESRASGENRQNVKRYEKILTVHLDQAGTVTGIDFKNDFK